MRLCDFSVERLTCQGELQGEQQGKVTALWRKMLSVDSLLYSTCLSFHSVCLRI